MKKLFLICIVLVFCILLAGCERGEEVVYRFSVGDKVCYVDDETLTGRVLYIDSSQPYYRVRWRFTSEQTGFLGCKKPPSPFVLRWHYDYELKPCAEEK